MTLSELFEAIMDLQSKVAFQEDTIHTLNNQVAAQDRALLQINKQMQVLYQKLGERGDEWDKDENAAQNEKPPHY